VKKGKIPMLKIQGHIFLVFLLLCIIRCAYANNADKVAVHNAYLNWCTAISEAKGRPSKIAKFYAPDAVLLPTLSPEVLVNRYNGLNAYFAKLTNHSDIRCTPKKLMTQLEGDIAINSGLYNFSYIEKDGSTKILRARFTFVYKMKEINGKQWLIIEHHSSVLPTEEMSPQK
jgi:hypothetical protein